MFQRYNKENSIRDKPLKIEHKNFKYEIKNDKSNNKKLRYNILLYALL